MVGLLAGALAACGPAAPATPIATRGPSPTPRLLGPTWVATSETPAPTPVPVPDVFASEWILGPEDASVSIVVYSDYQCVRCAQVDTMLAELAQRHPKDVRLIFRDCPLTPLHDKASLAAQAAAAAAAQGAYWPMHDLLFARQAEWTGLTTQDFVDWATTAAGTLRLDTAAFRTALLSGRYAAQMQEALRQAVNSGILAVPLLYFNGDLFSIPITGANLEADVRLVLLRSQQFDSIPPMTIDPAANYVAHLRLNIGTVDIQLYPDTAPVAVNSFVFLARRGWFDGNEIFHVVPGLMVEAGDPTGTGFGTPGYHFDLEESSRSFDRPGVVGVSSTGPGTNGSQFFVTLAPLPSLDGSRTIMGQVVAGLDHLQALAAREPLSDLLLPAAGVILSVTIEER